MPTPSLWQDTRTFFPLFAEELGRTEARSIAVVGASDGKFVLPLARNGYRVHAIERATAAIDGGPVVLPGGRDGWMAGLRRRLAEEDLGALVNVEAADLLDLTTPAPHDAVWTSCSWHYSTNHHRPLSDFIDRLKTLCRSGGLLGAEYMMPVEPRHHTVEHYLDEGQILRYLEDWPVLWETYTTPFIEDPHVEQLRPHVHRMGLVICRRPD